MRFVGGVVRTLTACSAMVVGGAAGPVDSNEGATRAQDVAPTSDISARFVHDPWTNAMDIDVVTVDGIVTLRGHVHSDGEARHALQAAKGVSGVRKVMARLAVVDH